MGALATGEVRIGIFAKEDVLPGVEITYDYMFQHGGLAAAAAAYRCAVLSHLQALAAQPPPVAMPLQMMAACTMGCIMGGMLLAETQDAIHCRCRCGAAGCRGTMDSQPERFRDFGQRVEVRLTC